MKRRDLNCCVALLLLFLAFQRYFKFAERRGMIQTVKRTSMRVVYKTLGHGHVVTRIACVSTVCQRLRDGALTLFEMAPVRLGRSNILYNINMLINTCVLASLMFAPVRRSVPDISSDVGCRPCPASDNGRR